MREDARAYKDNLIDDLIDLLRKYGFHQSQIKIR